MQDGIVPYEASLHRALAEERATDMLTIVLDRESAAAGAQETDVHNVAIHRFAEYEDIVEAARRMLCILGDAPAAATSKPLPQLE